MQEQYYKSHSHYKDNQIFLTLYKKYWQLHEMDKFLKRYDLPNKAKQRM